MSRSNSWAEKYVLDYRSVILLSVLLGIPMMILKSVADHVRSSNIVWEGACTVAGWKERDDAHIGAEIDCGNAGKSTLMTSSFVISYLRNPGPIQCRVDIDGKVQSCGNQPKLPTDNKKE